MNNSQRYGVCLQMSSKPIYLKMYIYIYTSIRILVVYNVRVFIPI